MNDKPRSFGSILVANRGEIAVRVMRTAKSLGYRTIAVHSEADAGAPHVALADEAILIGPGPVGESYLDPVRILEAARLTGAEAIHPGYGFLSENADFARACEHHNLVFIGPDAAAIEAMGDKASAKRLMKNAGVPCVPGYEGEDQSEEALTAAAEGIGFPVMVKAAAGGGGRGMRLVADPAKLSRALQLARSEAQKAFGNGDLILEKAIMRPRHVELQVFGDAHGNIIHLGERDCSVQRRHQKVIEEAPCPVLSPQLRERMGAAAVEAARAINYRGAGTVEFLLDADNQFYFLEMNTRLQVEHPVTEMISGLDLVAMQIEVAQGRALQIEQSDVRLNGHAIEIRLYAEDPAKRFFPSTGTIHHWRPPHGDGVRCDSGITGGQVIPPFYDPMLAKIIAWGTSRDQARRRLIKALTDTAIFGVATNRAFLIEALARQTFEEGGATTAFIEEEFAGGTFARPEPSHEQLAMMAVVLHAAKREKSLRESTGVHTELLEWSNTTPLQSWHGFSWQDGEAEIAVTSRENNAFHARLLETECEIELLEFDATDALLVCNEKRHRLQFFLELPGQLFFSENGSTITLRPTVVSAHMAGSGDADGTVTAPMPGTLLD